jgi:hypothetical protein
VPTHAVSEGQLYTITSITSVLNPASNAMIKEDLNLYIKD